MSDPVRAEADGVEIADVEWGGRVWKVPADADDWPFEVTEAVDDAKMSHVIRGLLDDTQYAEFKKRRPTNRDAGALFAAIAKTLGLESPGE